MITFYDVDCTIHSKTLPIEESRHGLKSLRLRFQEEFEVVNGNGLKIHAVMTDNQDGLIHYEIVRHELLERSQPSLHMAVSPLKQPDRFEYFVEKATELGVKEISPILCKRTEKPKIKADRLDRILISAVKQSGNAYKPILNPLISLDEFLKNCREKSRYIAHCEELKKESLKNLKFKDDTVFLIGPEGDFTQEEIDAALQHGFQATSLGDLTLRTETAALCVSSYFQISK